MRHITKFISRTYVTWYVVSSVHVVCCVTLQTVQHVVQQLQVTCITLTSSNNNSRRRGVPEGQLWSGRGVLA